MKNKLNIKNALMGLGGLAAVVAPVATLVACGSDKPVDNVQKAVAKYGIFPGSESLLTPVESAAVNVKTNTIDLEKVNNTYDLASIISKISGMNQIHGIADKLQPELLNPKNLQGINGLNPNAYKEAIESVHAIFEKVKNIKQDFVLKDGSHESLVTIDLSEEADRILKSLEETVYVNHEANGVLAMSWSKDQMVQLIAQVKTELSIDDQDNDLNIGSVQLSQDQMTTLDSFINMMVSAHGHFPAGAKASLTNLIKNGINLIKNVQEQMNNVVSTTLIQDIAQTIGLDALQPVLGLTSLPAPVIGIIFDVLHKISDETESIQNTEAYKNWSHRTGANPSSNEIISKHVDSSTPYTDADKDPNAVFNAALAFLSIM